MPDNTETARVGGQHVPSLSVQPITTRRFFSMTSPNGYPAEYSALGKGLVLYLCIQLLRLGLPNLDLDRLFYLVRPWQI